MRTAALLASGVVYVALVLFAGLQSPLFAVVFVALAAHEVIADHRTRHKG